MAKLFVLNAAGERELFSFQKVYQSARRAGAARQTAERIVRGVAAEAYPGIPTAEIFQQIQRQLKKETLQTALKFSLKEGMKKLGPTGFAFEKFVGEIFKRRGFAVKLNQYLFGACLADYEIDFLAQKEELVYVGECKYRQLAGERVHIDDVLANHARFLDILKGNYFKDGRWRRYRVKSLMVTNTKFTERASGYAACAGIDLLGWRYPAHQGLEFLIAEHNLYPVTILPSLKGHLKDVFVDRQIMLAEDVLRIDPREFASRARIPRPQLSPLISEARALFDSGPKKGRI